jgi:translation initiation factor 5B
MFIRQPIVAVMGHVDHGKTSLLDTIRSTNIAKKEAGAITQHIGASEISIEEIKAMCGELLEKNKIKFTIPGLLFIDTPGHESFTHLRERGGSIADIAILVVDVSVGFQPQTHESIMILKEYKTPFVVAANKIDLINGWKTKSKDFCGISAAIENQLPEVEAKLDEAIYKIVAELSKYNIDSERFDRVTNFQKQVSIIPVSAKTKEGIPELLLYLAGLSQKFLKLEVDEGKYGEGTILEVREEKGIGTTIDVILYDGRLKKNDEIIFGTLSGASKTKVRAILKPNPKKSGEYEYVDQVYAAAGIKIFAPGVENALAGSPLLVDDGNPKTDQLKEIENMIKEIISESEKNGVIVKADTLGSLQALKKLLFSKNVEIKRAGIGQVVKKDVLDASVVKNQSPLQGVVLSFNVQIAEDAYQEAARLGVKIFQSQVIYSLCEEYLLWVSEEKKRMEKEALTRLPFPVKLKVLHGCIFRVSKPAIFGVEVISGKLKKGEVLINQQGEIIGQVKEIQKEGNSLEIAQQKDQVAISVDEAVCKKSFFEGDYLYSYITPKQAEAVSSLLSSSEEKQTLEEIISITKRKLPI